MDSMRCITVEAVGVVAGSKGSIGVDGVVEVDFEGIGAEKVDIVVVEGSEVIGAGRAGIGDEEEVDSEAIAGAAMGLSKQPSVGHGQAGDEAAIFEEI